MRELSSTVFPAFAGASIRGAAREGAGVGIAAAVVDAVTGGVGCVPCGASTTAAGTRAEDAESRVDSGACRRMSAAMTSPTPPLLENAAMRFEYALDASTLPVGQRTRPSPG